MTLRIFLHLKSKRAETVALLDLEAMENFMSLDYAKYLHLPIKMLKEPRKLFNVDGTPNRAGDLRYFTDLATRTGTKLTMLRYFLLDLGDNKVILGYPWFAAAQPKIDWAKGWIAYDQLPIVLRAPDASKACFLLTITHQTRHPHKKKARALTIGQHPPSIQGLQRHLQAMTRRKASPITTLGPCHRT